MPSIIEAYVNDEPMEADLVEPNGVASVNIFTSGIPRVLVTICSHDDTKTEIFEFSRPEDLDDEDEDEVYESLCGPETRVAVLRDQEDYATRRITRLGGIASFAIRHERHLSPN